LELRDPRPGLAAFSETATLIRLRLPLNERLLELREEAERLADRMDRALAEYVLDGSHTVSRADGGPSHIVVQYGFHSAVGSADRAREVRAAHSSLFAVIAAERESFAQSQEHV
ncbi:MAG: hypothetical protein J0M12_16585, partial [Deltaproteobacteria bacterium]|nr:hypothetical protein [Deltaproteobacteria bacterium]